MVTGSWWQGAIQRKLQDLLRRRQPECLQSLRAFRASHKKTTTNNPTTRSQDTKWRQLKSNDHVEPQHRLCLKSKHKIHISYGAFWSAMWYLPSADVNPPSMRRCSVHPRRWKQAVDSRFAVYDHLSIQSMTRHIPWAFVSSISVHEFLLELAHKPWPTPRHDTGNLEFHATCAWQNWELTCAKSVTDWRRLKCAIYDFIIRACSSFAMIACKTSLMNVTSVSGKRSFIIMLYLLIQWFKTAFHSACGLQFLTTHVVVVTATPFGFHVDGYAGDKLRRWLLWYWSFDEQDDVVQKITEDEHLFATRVGGNPESKLKLSDTFHVQSCRS